MTPVDPRSLPAPALAPNSALGPSSALGPANARTLAIAAEILRERTMSMDPDESAPAKSLVLTLIALTIVAAGAVVLFRHELRWLLNLV